MPLSLDTPIQESRLPTLTRKVIKRLSLGDAPIGILARPDGRAVYVALSGEDKVVVLDPASWETIAVIETGNTPDGMAWSSR